MLQIASQFGVNTDRNAASSNAAVVDVHTVE